MELTETKRKRKKPNGEYGYDPQLNGIDPNNLDPALLELTFPPGTISQSENSSVNCESEFHERFAAAIFEIGLRHSSPKVLVFHSKICIVLALSCLLVCFNARIYEFEHRAYQISSSKISYSI